MGQAGIHPLELGKSGFGLLHFTELCQAGDLVAQPVWPNAIKRPGPSPIPYGFGIVPQVAIRTPFSWRRMGTNTRASATAH